jgi:Glyoxalase-like domain
VWSSNILTSTVPGLPARFYLTPPGGTWGTPKEQSKATVDTGSGSRGTFDVAIGYLRGNGCYESKTIKNRLHIDLVPKGCDQDEEVSRLLALGAKRAEVGQGDAP